MAASLYFVFATCAILIAIFLNYPPADFSSELREWSESGYYFNYKGQAIFYKDEKGVKTENPVVLCIHGFPTNSHDWSKIWGRLKDNFGRVIAADMLGHGFSDKPLKDYTVFEQADIQEKLLEHLNVNQVHLLAHDLGDTVAQEMLARFEARNKKKGSEINAVSKNLEILSLCLSNGGIFPEANFPRPIQKLALYPWIGPLIGRFLNFALFSSRFASVFGPLTEPSEANLKDFWAVLRHKDGHIVVPRILQYINQRKANRKRWVGVLETTAIPVHLICGPADPVNPQMLQRFRELVSHGTATVLVPTIGHYPHWEDPAGFINGYQQFLKKFEFYE